MADTNYASQQILNQWNDATIGGIKSIDQSPTWRRYIDVVPLVSGDDIGAVADTWIDAGAEIDCRGYTRLKLWVSLTVNNSTGNQLQVLEKHTSAGSDEYDGETAADYQKTIGDADRKVPYQFELGNNTPYIQVQTKATVLGATEGTINIDYTLGYT